MIFLAIFNSDLTKMVVHGKFKSSGVKFILEGWWGIATIVKPSYLPLYFILTDLDPHGTKGLIFTKLFVRYFDIKKKNIFSWVIWKLDLRLNYILDTFIFNHEFKEIIYKNAIWHFNLIITLTHTLDFHKLISNHIILPPKTCPLFRFNSRWP